MGIKPNAIMRVLQGFENAGGTDAIKDYLVKQKQNRDKAAFFKAMDDYQQKLQQAGQPKTEVMNQVVNPINAGIGAFQNGNNNNVPALAKVTGKTQLSNLPVTQPSIQTTQEIPVSEQDQEKRIADALFGFLKETNAMDNLSPDTYGKGMNAVDLLTSKYTPKPTQMIPVSDGADILGYNPNSKKVDVLYKNTKLRSLNPKDITQYELDEKGQPKVYDLPNKQKAHKKITRDATGQQIKEDYEPLQFEPKGTSVNIEGQNPKANIHTTRGKLAEYVDSYDYYDKITKDNSKSEKEKKTAEEQKGIWLGKLKNASTDMSSQINDIVPNFEGTVNLLFQKIGDNPDKIDSTVEETLKGKDADVIRWAKDILHSRIFK